MDEVVTDMNEFMASVKAGDAASDWQVIALRAIQDSRQDTFDSVSFFFSEVLFFPPNLFPTKLLTNFRRVPVIRSVDIY